MGVRGLNKRHCLSRRRRTRGRLTLKFRLIFTPMCFALFAIPAALSIPRPAFAQERRIEVRRAPAQRDRQHLIEHLARVGSLLQTARKKKDETEER